MTIHLLSENSKPHDSESNHKSPPTQFPVCSMENSREWLWWLQHKFSTDVRSLNQSCIASRTTATQMQQSCRVLRCLFWQALQKSVVISSNKISPKRFNKTIHDGILPLHNTTKTLLITAITITTLSDGDPRLVDHPLAAHRRSSRDLKNQGKTSTIFFASLRFSYSSRALII